MPQEHVCSVSFYFLSSGFFGLKEEISTISWFIYSNLQKRWGKDTIIENYNSLELYLLSLNFSLHVNINLPHTARRKVNLEGRHVTQEIELNTKFYKIFIKYIIYKYILYKID